MASDFKPNMIVTVGTASVDCHGIVTYEPVEMTASDFDFIKTRDRLTDSILYSARVPFSAFTPSPLYPAICAIEALEASRQYLDAILQPTRADFEKRFLRIVEAEIERIAIEELMAELESRRWCDYLTRQFRGMPGMRLADLVRGVGRN